MATATIRDLRTRFPHVRRLVERDGEVIVTHRGRPTMVLHLYQQSKVKRPPRLDYLERLRSYMPRPLSARARRALDEADRGER
jgi:antitoxin (DNA-binding transcriptional repressor) of toxin-antitoxin stability system